MVFRLGVIGAGTHGSRYLRHAARDVPGMTATALCRRNETEGRALAAELGCRYYRKTADLIADSTVDGVLVCTPPASHFQLARDVMKAGKPLLLEKPLTGTLEQAEQLARLDADSGTPLMLAQTLRWNPVIRKAKELLPRLGQVHLVRMAQRLAPTDLAWQRNLSETVGGSVLLTGVHLFDTVRFLTGREFREVDSRQDRILNPVVEDFFLARAILDDGCAVSLEVSKYTHSRAAWLEIVGEEGQLWADYLAGGIVLRRGGDEERFEITAQVPTLPLVLRDWLECIENDETPPVTVQDGLATLRVVEACYRSAELETPVNPDATNY